MSTIYLIDIAIAVALFAYLIYALVKAEDF